MNIVTELTRIYFLVVILLYTLEAYLYFGKKSERSKSRGLGVQIALLTMFSIGGFGVIFYHHHQWIVLLFLAGVLSYNTLTLVLFSSFYPKCSMLLLSNMLMLLNIGFVILARLDFDKAMKQGIIVGAGTILALLVPVMIRKLRVLEKLQILYAILGIGALRGVLALAVTSRGAKLSITVAGITIQFSEIVKITFVFYMAARLAKDRSFRSVVVTSVVAALHVGILVFSTDLGAARVFFVAYLVVIFVATGRPIYPLVGLLGGAAASVVAYFLFAHVQQRVIAWKDPFAVYETSGYQIVQGLFGIGAGGWFGTGLCEGKPTMIPVAAKDFVFAAICEEFGSIFGICLLLICMSIFLLICTISLKLHNRFYKLAAIGLGAEYAFQVFLTVGGVTKFIPMTGITLPLVSYGGSSVISTIVMLSIVQGMYIRREDEGV